jgi:hypothetical protein
MDSYKDWLNIRPQMLDCFENDSIISEGLIRSYPMRMVRNFIKQRKDFLDMSSIFDESSFNILLQYDPNNKNFLEDFNNFLYKFGYFVSKVINSSEIEKTITLSIEMRFPTMVNMEKIPNRKWYHITNTQNLKNIKRIGIGPRGTTTAYNYPDDRIYVIHVKDPDDPLLTDLANNLYAAKLNHIRKSKNMKLIENWEDSYMALLNITLDPSYKVRYDPMVGIYDDYVAGFTTKYIPPNKITIVKEF